MKKRMEPKPATAPAPEWVNETPPDHCYSLDMYQNSDYSTESVALTRTEYIALKQHLAGMRGIIPVAAAAEPAAESPAAVGEVIDLIAWFADIEEASCGCDTPAEDFIIGLVMWHHMRPLTPDAAARKLEKFREDFDSMADATRIFVAKYPEAVKAAAAA